MRYKVPNVETKEIAKSGEVTITDPRFALDILTDVFLDTVKLSNRALIALTIPLQYDPSRKAFVVPERTQVTQALIYGRYYGAAPPIETVPGDYQLAVDEQHRLLVIDNRLAVDTAGRLAVQNPPALDVALSTRASESTLAAIKTQTDKLTFESYNTLRVGDFRIYNPGDAEIYTTTPLSANAAYYGPSRDFGSSRLGAMGIIGYADQPSMNDGVYIQLSVDNTNWDYRGATATLSSAGAVALAQVVAARYARVVWVNGPTAQTTFRLGGRYMIAGSELPVFSPAPAPQPEPVCAICRLDMTETSDFFYENGIVYCPKCYAQKRWRELKEKERRAWEKSLRAWLRHATEHEQTRARMHAPDEVVEQ